MSLRWFLVGFKLGRLHPKRSIEWARVWFKDPDEAGKKKQRGGWGYEVIRTTTKTILSYKDE